jgi:hypothetical protein
MNKYYLKKDYAIDYTEDITNIINTISFNNGATTQVLGSMGDRALLFGADYDCYEIVEHYGLSLENFGKKLKKKFQQIINKLMNIELCYIGDIKCGEVKEWKVLNDDVKIEDNKVINYNSVYSKNKLDYLFENNIINSIEYKQKIKLLKTTITPNELFIIKDEFKYHTLRWEPNEILNGYKELSDGSKINLEEAFFTNSITKLDVISWVNGNRFTDISIIYDFKFNGKSINTMGDFKQTIKEDILNYSIEKNYFKYAKRLYSFAKFIKDEDALKELMPLLNDDISILYQIFSDLSTIEYLIENEKILPISRLKFEEDQFKQRLSNITLPQYLNHRLEILNMIDHLKVIDQYDRSQMLRLIKKLKDRLNNIIQDNAKKYLKKIGFLPIPKSFLP